MDKRIKQVKGVIFNIDLISQGRVIGNKPSAHGIKNWEQVSMNALVMAIFVNIFAALSIWTVYFAVTRKKIKMRRRTA